MNRTAICLVLAVPLPAAGEAAGQVRTSLSVINETGYVAGMRAPGAEAANLTLVEPSFSYRRGERWRFSTSLVGMLDWRDQTTARLRVRETYVGVTAGGVDFVAGKRIVRWGTGHAFTPTGILDPPRDPADPTDRLNLNQGREMVQADLIRGRHDFTAAWASAGLLAGHRPGMRETLAFRYNTLVSGFDTSLVVAHDRGRPTLAGANFSRVFGEAIEAHGEFAWRDGATLLAGGRYAVRSGLSFAGEFYSRAAGLNPSGPVPRLRRNYVFFRVSKSRLRELPGWKEWDATASLIANVSDGSRMGVFDVERRLLRRCSVYWRAQVPQGRQSSSEYGAIPYRVALSFGFRVQL